MVNTTPLMSDGQGELIHDLRERVMPQDSIAKELEKRRPQSIPGRKAQ